MTMKSDLRTEKARDVDKCTKSPTGEHVWNYAPRPDNCRIGTCRYCEQQRVFEGALTHTAAILKPAPVKPETLEKAAVIAEKSLIRKVTEPAPAGRKSNRGGYKLSDKQKADIKLRIKAGDKVRLIAADFLVTDEVIYIFRRQMGIHGKNGKKAVPAATPAPSQVQPEPPIATKSNGHKQSVVYDNQHRGNLALQLLRLKRGELRPQTVKTVIQRYKAMLEYDLDKAQKQARDTKHSLEMVNDALLQLDVIQQGEKAVVDKVLAAVR